MTSKSTNTVWHHATITRAAREKLHKHRSVILWFTGLSGSGKSTLAHAVEDYTQNLSLEDSVQQVIALLVERGIIHFPHKEHA